MAVVFGGAKKYIFSFKNFFYNYVDNSTLIPGTKDYFDNYMNGRFILGKNSKKKLIMFGVIS